MTESGLLTKRQQHIISLVFAGIGISASILAFVSWGTFYSANQAFAQPYLSCANWAFSDPFEFPGLTGPSYRLPRSVTVNLTVARTDSIYSLLPNIAITWKYALSYRFGRPLTGTLPLITQNVSGPFEIGPSNNHRILWKFDIFDFTRQNDFFNITIMGDEMTEQYSAYPVPFEVTHPAHETRFLNLFLPVYEITAPANYTLRQGESYIFYHQRAQQAAFAIYGGITSMLSIATGSYGTCGRIYNGTDIYV